MNILETLWWFLTFVALREECRKVPKTILTLSDDFWHGDLVKRLGPFNEPQDSGEWTSLASSPSQWSALPSERKNLHFKLAQSSKCRCKCKFGQKCFIPKPIRKCKCKFGGCQLGATRELHQRRISSDAIKKCRCKCKFGGKHIQKTKKKCMYVLFCCKGNLASRTQGSLMPIPSCAHVRLGKTRRCRFYARPKKKHGGTRLSPSNARIKMLSTLTAWASASRPINWDEASTVAKGFWPLPQLSLCLSAALSRSV